MPTHDEWTQFLREWAKLTPQQQTLFLAAVEEMVEDLRIHGPFRPSLRVKGVKRSPGVFEMTWAPDGRATFHYGSPVIPGEAHIIWRRIGGHDILQNP
ncbi:MAG TPA: hypothetical protein VF120_02100 [Ktedonobacterales bacterium]